jgi:predicted Zn-dependent protease
LGELLQRKGDFIAAAKQYELVSGDPDYNFTARFNAAQCYYEALGGKNMERSAIYVKDGQRTETQKSQPAAQAVNLDRDALRARAITTLRDAIRMEPSAEQSAQASQRKALHDSRGRAIYMLATLLEHQPRIDYREVASILDDYETRYPAMTAHFNQTFEWRVEALDDTEQYPLLEREAKGLVAHDATTPAYNDYVKEIGIDFWKNAAVKQTAGNHRGYVEDARLTVTTYEYFERMVNAGNIPAKNLTGTLSILGQAYLATGDVDRAATIFNQVVKADPGSPDANAGLARIAQTRKNYKDALDLWSRVESVAAESDPLFYESKYSMAMIFAEQGKTTSACNKLAATRNEHPNLGSADMKEQWDALQHKVCPNPTES